MKGGIYSDDKCPICGGPLIDNHINALACPIHPKCRATSFRVKFNKVYMRVRSYEKAARILNGLRFKVDENTFDERDYRKDTPLGFSTLMEQWYNNKTVESVNRKGEVERKIKKGTVKNYRHYKEFFCSYFGNRNIKEIAEDEGGIDDCLNSLTTVGNKTKSNYRSALNDFFTWVWKRNKKSFAKAGISRPDLPEISFTLGYRKLLSKDTQFDVLEEVKRISAQNPKVYLGIKWLCTYVKVRPGEMLALKEREINLDTGHLLFPTPKENEWKSVKLTVEDLAIIKSFPRSLPSMPFFRHTGGLQGCADNQPFGEKYLYKWWKRACENLGIEGVDLYGGTKHSSVTALKKKYSPETIKRSGTGHKTNTAFDRYLHMDDEDSEALYQDATPRKSTPAQVIEIGTGLAPGKTP